MIRLQDQLDRKIQFNDPPSNIVSLVPSMSELVAYLGHETAIVGCTKFCVHPSQLGKEATIIGGTKNVHIEKVKALKPDLVLCNKEENVKVQVEAIEKFCTVYISNVATIEDAIQMNQDLGIILQEETESLRLNQRIRSLKEEFFVGGKRVAYLIWQNPLMTIGGDTFIHSMLANAGFENVFMDRKRYPSITTDELKASDAEYIFLSSEPYPFAEKHQMLFQQHFPDKKVFLVDGEMTSWYGNRMLLGLQYLNRLHQRLLPSS